MNGLKQHLSAAAGPMIAHRVSPVLLYHTTFSEIPTPLGSLVHNVHPDRLIDQVRWLAKQFEFVSIDEWFERGQRMGTACLTFDDGYRCVFDEALPLLIEHGIPSTVFLNGTAFEGTVFWRDRVAFVINNGLTADFLASSHARVAGLDDMQADDFYDQSRQPDRSSKLVDEALTAYMVDIGREGELERFTAHHADQLTDHPLVTYGCHTYSHYVPSSLTAAEQEHELEANKQLLDELGVNRSRVFSIPFGGARAINSETTRLLREYDFVGVLFSRNAVNFSRPKDLEGIPSAERYMVPPDLSGLQERQVRLGIANPHAPVRRAVQRAVNLVRA